VNLLDLMFDAAHRLGCIAVCSKCLHPGEFARSVSYFNDYDLCGRCRFVQTAADKAYWVRP
jgi:hypothetical protein